MKQSRFSDSQIVAILKQAENGIAVPDVCREHGISVPTFYKWRAKFGGMDASLIVEMKELEAYALTSKGLAVQRLMSSFISMLICDLSIIIT